MPPSPGLTEYGTAQPATDVGFFLGEGVTWDPLRGEVRWVDILAGTVWRGALAAGGAIAIRDSLVFPDTAGAVAIARSGAMVVAGRHHLYRRGDDGGVRKGPRVASGSQRRLNDGKADPVGRFLVGTQADSSELLSIGRDGAVRTIDSDLTASNGLAWSPDGRLLYHVDTLTGRIFVREYDPGSGATAARRTLAMVGDAAGGGLSFDVGLPDGMTTDSEGCLWIAMWGGGCVLRLDPDGRPMGIVRVPAPQVSCVTFAGRDLATMVITTARQGLSSADIDRFPLSGRLFTAAPGVSGNAPYWWADTW